MNWGDEKAWLTHRHPEALAKAPLGATEMGLIYVNPEGPDHSGEPLSAAAAIRATFGNMGMNDEETVALIAGGHTLGKTHGAAAASHVGADPEAAPIEAQGLGWASSYGSGVGADAITSGLEVVWTQTPTQWSNYFFENLFKYEWVQTRSPAGAIQFEAVDAPDIIPDPFDPSKKRKPTMLVTDLTLRFDPEFEKISRRFLNDPQAFNEAFARAWFKLTHRDMGPKARYIGPEVPKEDLIWQDPLPQPLYQPTQEDIINLKAAIAASGLSISEMVSVAWASASTFRGGDKRGGANGARLALAPQRDWEVNAVAARVLPVLEEIQKTTNKASLADIIVLAGVVGIEQAAAAAGVSISVPFAPGRVDARQDQTDIEMFSLLEPIADGFRNYRARLDVSTTESLLIDKAQQLTLTAPEMTVLVGGMRVLGTNFDGSQNGVFTDRPGVLSTDFFANLLDMRYEWKPTDDANELFEGRDRLTGEVKYTRPAPIWCLVPTPYCARWRKFTRVAMRTRSFVKDFVAAWGESDEPGPFRSVVNLMPDDANAYPAYRLICPPGKKIPRNCGDFSLQADLIPILQEALTVLVGDQQRGVHFIRRCAARHVMNSFTFCAGGFRDGAHFCRNILFNIQLRQRNRQANGMAQRRNGFDFFDRARFPAPVASAYRKRPSHRDNSGAHPESPLNRYESRVLRPDRRFQNRPRSGRCWLR
ncbi:catalase [Salmonella enterica subsp. enterica]|uniref:Catalase-peroxidase n=1 Tax=Salmonella enterica I TaxID=59201 RepID=A0A3S4FBP2_SALET|nr:catalase [Salmonella enterica subsp. enterica]